MCFSPPFSLSYLPCFSLLLLYSLASCSFCFPSLCCRSSFGFLNWLVFLDFLQYLLYTTILYLLHYCIFIFLTILPFIFSCVSRAWKWLQPADSVSFQHTPPPHVSHGSPNVRFRVPRPRNIGPRRVQFRVTRYLSHVYARSFLHNQ